MRVLYDAIYIFIARGYNKDIDQVKKNIEGKLMRNGERKTGLL